MVRPRVIDPEHVLELWATGETSARIAAQVGGSAAAVRQIACGARKAGDPRASNRHAPAGAKARSDRKEIERLRRALRRIAKGIVPMRELGAGWSEEQRRTYLRGLEATARAALA